MSRQRVLAGTLAWIAVVATVSALVWVVISRAGDDLVSSGEPLATTGDQSTARTRTPSPRTPSPTASPTQQPSRTVTEERRTWQGQAGTVVAACGATGIRLVSAQPADGFRAVAARDDATLEIEFEGREDRLGTDAKVVARCVGGIPSFVVGGDD